jgi:opacity protein-like surface antigen
VAVVAGGKYVFGSGMVRPYVGAGLGTIHLKRTVVEARLGDVTRAVYNDFDLGEADLSLATEGITRLLAEAAFGVGIGAGRTHFDVGYRYRSAFRMSTELNFSQVTAGIGYRF